VNDKRATPKVSVVVPTYNRADLVALAIDSVLAQTYPDFEIIVVDDGSQDGTCAVVKAYPDPRIRYIYQDNTGLAGARNAGMRTAKGRYVAFLDADDLFLPENLAHHIRTMESRSEVDFAAGGHVYVDRAGRRLAERRPWLCCPAPDLTTWLHGCPIVPSAVLVRTEWLNKVGGFDPALRRAEDRDLWLRLAAFGCRMAWTSHVVSAYRVHPGQMVKDGSKQKETTIAVLNKFFDQPSLPGELGQERQEAFAKAYLSGAFREYGAKQVDSARQSLVVAIGLAPALMAGSIPPLTDALVSWAADPITGSPAVFVERVLENLPVSMSHLRSLRRRIVTAATIRAAVDANIVGNDSLARQHLIEALQIENSSFDNVTLVIEQLVDYVRCQEYDCQVTCIENFFNNLPSELAKLLPFRRKALGHLHMTRTFESYEKREITKTRAAVIRGVYYDPSWLRNRGVWSIVLRSWLGRSSYSRRTCNRAS
jgi:GT2 family glycosyltransferase